MWIECGIINYKLIIPLIYPLFYQIRRIIHKNDEKPFLQFFTNYLGYLLSGLIYLFIKWRMKKKKVITKNNDLSDKDVDTIVYELNDLFVPTFNDSFDRSSTSPFVKVKTLVNTKTVRSEHSNQIALEKIKIEKKNSKRKHLFILLLVVIYLIPMLLDAFNPYAFKTSSSVSLFFSIISYVIFGRLILGMKIYTHQIFALIIILVGNIIIVLLVFIGKELKDISMFIWDLLII